MSIRTGQLSAVKEQKVRAEKAEAALEKARQITREQMRELGYAFSRDYDFEEGEFPDFRNAEKALLALGIVAK